MPEDAPLSNAQRYLDANPDVLANAEARAEGMDFVEGGRQGFLESVAREHYDSFGMNEGRANFEMQSFNPENRAQFVDNTPAPSRDPVHPTMLAIAEMLEGTRPVYDEEEDITYMQFFGKKEEPDFLGSYYDPGSQQTTAQLDELLARINPTYRRSVIGGDTGDTNEDMVGREMDNAIRGLYVRRGHLGEIPSIFDDAGGERELIRAYAQLGNQPANLMGGKKGTRSYDNKFTYDTYDGVPLSLADIEKNKYITLLNKNFSPSSSQGYGEGREWEGGLYGFGFEDLTDLVNAVPEMVRQAGPLTNLVPGMTTPITMGKFMYDNPDGLPVTDFLKMGGAEGLLLGDMGQTWNYATNPAPYVPAAAMPIPQYDVGTNPTFDTIQYNDLDPSQTTVVSRGLPDADQGYGVRPAFDQPFDVSYPLPSSINWDQTGGSYMVPNDQGYGGYYNPGYGSYYNQSVLPYMNDESTGVTIKDFQIGHGGDLVYTPSHVMYDPYDYSYAPGVFGDYDPLNVGFKEGGSTSLKDSLQIDTPRRTPNHPSSSHVVKTMVNGKEKMIRFGEQGAKTNQNPKQRKAFKDRHRKNINKGKSSAAYWADKVKWKAAEGGLIEFNPDEISSLAAEIEKGMNNG